MFRTIFKPHWILPTLTIALTASLPYSFAFPLSPAEHPVQSPVQNPSGSQTPSPSESPSPPPRKPRNQLGGRGGGNLCAVSPGLLERQNIVWSDRPLFLWQASPKVMLQQIQLVDSSRRILWEKSLATTDQSALYVGQPLQPGQFYTWRLQWTLQDAEQTAGSADYTFQLMEPQQQQQIASELQTLTQRLQASGEDAETIANQQADYLLTRSQPLWSDALKVLYTIENPSSQTTQKLQLWINTACGQEETGDAPTSSSPNP
jgi:hypothetical protein